MADEVPCTSSYQPIPPHRQTSDERWVEELSRQGSTPRLPGTLRRVLGDRISAVFEHALRGFPPESALKAHQESQVASPQTTINQRR